MKEAKNKDDEEILITFSDLVSLAKNNKKKIRGWAIFFALLALCYALTKPVVYEAEATFKEKGKSKAGLSNYLSATLNLLSDSSQESDAMTMLQSRKLLEELIRKQGLQGQIDKITYTFPFVPFATIKDNLLAEYANYKHSHFPIVKDPTINLKASAVTYEHEVPTSLRLQVLPNDAYLVIDSQGTDLGAGIFGSPFYAKDFSFTIVKLNPDDLQGQEYSLNLMPLSKIAKAMLKDFSVKPDKEDKSLIKILHTNKNRKQAADNINMLMAIYQQYIEDEYCLLCEKQTEYLVQRQRDMANELELMMENYASRLSSDLSSTGFATSGKAMEFLAANQQQLKQQLFILSIEIQRLENAQMDPTFDGELFSSTGHLDVFNKIAAEKRQFKQLSDSLNLAIRGVQESSTEFHSTFPTQLAEQDENKQFLSDTSEMIAALDHNEIPRVNKKLMDNPKFIIKEWHNRLTAAKQHFDKNASDIEAFEEWQHCKEGYSAYLDRLNHYLKVNQRNIEERLANQQGPNSAEYLGINLNIAKDLYFNYTEELCKLESMAREHDFVIQQIDEPDFEISSLSTILTDSISTDMIKHTGTLLLTLRDHENRSNKEQERVMTELAIQKGFLKNHLLQSSTILNLRHDLLRKKIRDIQNVTFSLVQEELSILESQLKDYLTSALENLRQEEALLNQNLAELRLEMGAFPKKWTAEQLIEHQMDINKTLVEEISKLVESKNVSNNMEKFQSAPVDISNPPLHPKSPRVILMTILGGIFGACLGFIWLLGWSVIHGVKANPESLRTASLHVSGAISRQYRDNLEKDPLLDSDLETLRRLLTFIIPKESDENLFSTPLGHTLLLVEGKGPDYSHCLAELMSKMGLKVVIACLRFEADGEMKSLGLLQYIEGKAEQPTVMHKEHYDYIPAGGYCRYSNELIGSQRFKELISSLKKKYQWIIISTSALPACAEAESLLDMFNCAAISVQDESVQDLQNTISKARSSESKITFIF